MPRTFAVVATDAETGAMTVFNRGDSGSAVRASASVPRMFVAPVIHGRQYVDGGITSPVPVKVARAMGADLVIAVDISRLATASGSSGSSSSAGSPFSRSSRRVLLEAELAQADIVIEPAVPRTRMLDFKRKMESIAVGEAAGEAAIPEVRAALRRVAIRKANESQRR